MNDTTPNTCSTMEIPAVVSQGDSQDDSRCQYRFPNGRRCRLPGSASRSGFCFRHFHLSIPLPQTPSDGTDLSADLLPGLSEFSSADDIRLFLARLLILVTKGRISPRRASVLAFITNQLLHSHRAIGKEEPTQIIFDLPSPRRD